ncbi:MAG TPA: glutamine synthetase type III, partial [Gemmatimonadaceae bacterium]|nr:glutamine synthetase type III [Gemmatimonadaceae bacterium]
ATTPVRFEGNNYSAEWVKEAAKRGLLNLRRTPEALAQLATKTSKKCLVGLRILTEEELESRYHVRLERYIKDMLIELHTLRETVDTMVLPAALQYVGSLATSAAQAKAAGIGVIPQIEPANTVGKSIQALQAARATLGKAIDKAEEMHDELEEQAEFLTREGAEAMAAVRTICDSLEVSIDDELWPLPKYREMLFPV